MISPAVAILFWFCVNNVLNTISEIFSINGPIIPKRGKKVGSIKITDKYTVSFDFVINSLYNGGNYASVLHIGGDELQVLDRYPGIFLTRLATKIHIGMGEVGNESRQTERPYNSEVSVGNLYNLRLEITQTYMNILLNNTLLTQVAKNYHLINIDKEIWIGLGKIGVPNITLTNIVIETFDYKELSRNILAPCGISSTSLVSWYKSDDFIVTPAEAYATLRWFDHSGNGNHILTSNVGGNITKNIKGYITGTLNGYINFPYQMQSTGYTLFHLARYETTRRLERIFTSDSNGVNWLSGFDGPGDNGVAFHNSWITDRSPKFGINDWVLSTDQFSLYRGNRHDFSNDKVITGFDFYMNINNWADEASDWSVYEVIIFDVELSKSQYTCIEDYIYNKYSCNNNSILGTPTCSPTVTPTLIPTNIPTVNPTTNPSTSPSDTPSNNPTLYPTIYPTKTPTVNPTNIPINISTDIPTGTPSTFLISQNQGTSFSANGEQLPDIIYWLIIGILFVTLCATIIGFILIIRRKNKRYSTTIEVCILYINPAYIVL